MLRDSPRTGLTMLGLLAICAYGGWYYAFGVLLDPILADTGWSESLVAASFSIGLVGIGVGSLFGGHLLDRFGSRVVLAVGGVATAGGLLVASMTNSSIVFMVAAATALTANGSLGFYHITMTAAVRLNPSAPDRAIAEVTIWGAFASVVFLPLAELYLGLFGWRTTVQLLAVTLLTAFWLSAWRLPQPEAHATEKPPLATSVRSAIARGQPRRLAAEIALAGIAMSTILIYQVPMMTSAGLSAATAAVMAAVRGACQLLGRLPISPVVRAVGVDTALVLSFVAMAASGPMLAFSGSTVVAASFALVAGVGIGAFSPLQGIKAAELFDTHILGAAMGVYGGALLCAGAIGPILSAVLSDVTGDRRWVAVVITVAASAAAVAARGLGRDRADLRGVDHAEHAIE